MAASILRVYDSIDSNASAPALWAYDEAIISYLVVHAPIFVAIFRKGFISVLMQLIERFRR
ncbi:hypothetical protein PG993_014587 [Apiospora rasikravindrae]|uniref:Uncharacterized protein n=1 Tax=Apiospora rasikravindrae TaxID=990691 RepID=A0ABR1RQ73_9PEZI